MSNFVVCFEVNGGKYESNVVFQNVESVELLSENSVMINGSIVVRFDEAVSEIVEN